MFCSFEKEQGKRRRDYKYRQGINHSHLALFLCEAFGCYLKRPQWFQLVGPSRKPHAGAFPAYSAHLTELYPTPLALAADASARIEQSGAIFIR